MFFRNQNQLYINRIRWKFLKHLLICALIDNLALISNPERFFQNFIMLKTIFILLFLTTKSLAQNAVTRTKYNVRSRTKQIPVKECFDDVCLGKGYSTNIPPPALDDNQPLIVNISFQLYNIISVDNDDNVIGITLALRQTWMENRIYPRKKGLIEQNGG